MKLRVLAASVILAVAVQAAADTYTIDGAHSTVIFKVRHMGVGNAYGRFNSISGTITGDPAAPDKSSIEFAIKADSLDTANAKRDAHLKGPDFFNVAQFPDIKFKSTAVKKTGEKTFEATGDLTLHGVTKPVTAKVEHIGTAQHPRGGTIAGAEARFTIKRNDFGITYMPDGLGDDVEVIVSVEAKKQ